MKSTRQNVYSAIDGERRYQDEMRVGPDGRTGYSPPVDRTTEEA